MENSSCCSSHLLPAPAAADATAAWSCEIPSRSGVNVANTLTLFAAGVLGNLLALLVLLRSRPSKSRTLFYTLLTALILNDMIGQVLTSTAPLAVYASADFNASARRLRLSWIGGHVTCQAHALVMTAMALSTPLLVLCMSVERVVCLKMWQNYSHEQQHRKTRLCLLAVFGLALTLASLPLLGVGAYGLQFPSTWCFIRSQSHVTSHRVFAACFGIWNLTMICLIAGCNIVVIHSLLVVRRLRRAVLKESRSTGHSVTASTTVVARGDHLTATAPRQHRGSNASGGAGGHRMMRHMEMQLVLLLVSITVTFGLCWSPLMVRVLWNALGGSPDCRRDLQAVYVASINQVLDPWLYILLRRGMLHRGWQLGRRLAAAAAAACAEYRRRRRERRDAARAAAPGCRLCGATPLRARETREMHPSKLNNSTSERADEILRDAGPALAPCECRCHQTGWRRGPPCNIDGRQAAAADAAATATAEAGVRRPRSRSLPEGRLQAAFRRE